eukprot:CAMPEP_0180543958 /NCGR_PEP_ID=MMETSP1036_2-20121128/69257_1 /TAXON_ID=632150 /ORGANISM="Azadinium spinosum, Strain 3D9" /LENGTH=130 /DNA_ID=CAMNT_0022558915 /DNA_START=138 /DNA_END=530 /DNA_ORIENTATION=-
MTNLVTGIFVTNVTNIVREDKDERIAAAMCDLFLDGADQITWEMFCAKLESPVMKEYLKSIDLNAAQAQGLFCLIDEDGGGTLDSAELVHGFLRLRGPAKSLDLLLLSRQVALMHKELHRPQTSFTRMSS